VGRIAAFGIIALLGTTLPAQTLNVRGRITNATGQPVSKAVVELTRRGLKDTTGSDGAYSLTGTVSVRRIPQVAGISLEQGELRLSLAQPASVKVEVFDLHGNLLRMEGIANAAAGMYRWDFAQSALSDRMIIIKASAGPEVRTFRYLPGKGAESPDNPPITGFTPAAAYLAKTSAAVDTLMVTAQGYLVKRLPLASWDTTVNITLDTVGSTGVGRSAGCGKASWPASKNYTIGVAYNNQTKNRSYILRIPDKYDSSHAYRLILAFHWSGGTAENVANGGGATTQPFYGLWDLAGGSTIFVAPQGIDPPNGWADTGGPGDPHDGPTNTASPGGQDIAFARALVNDLKSKLCIDTTRIFAEGFSMGGSMSYALACAMPETMRGVAVHSGGPMSGCVKLSRKPVAYFMTHGTQDGTCTYPGYGVPEVDDFAQLNGCQTMDITGTLKPTDQSGMHPACADFKGCSDGHPTRACIFVGPHTPIPGGGATTWVPGETWKFIQQF